MSEGRNALRTQRRGALDHLQSLALVIFGLFSCTFGAELRFCYNGPHRIRYQDCPGGFIAKKTIKPSCIYWISERGTPLKASVAGNVCDHLTYDTLADNPKENDFKNENELLRFWDLPSGANVSSPVDEKPDVCNETCLGEYLMPRHWGVVPYQVDKPPKDESATEELKKSYVDMTKLIMIKIINEDEYEEDIDSGEKALNSKELLVNWTESMPIALYRPVSNWTGRIDFLYENTDVRQSEMSSLLKILSKSMRLTYKKCKPYLEPSFYTLVFRAMQEFRRLAEFFPNMHVVPMTRILRALDNCENADNTAFELIGSSCEDKHIVTKIKNQKENDTSSYSVVPTSFRWSKYDPIIEAAWNGVQFVHGHCFRHFQEDILHFSLYVRAMTELFIQPIIQKHWTNPTTVGKGLTLWEMVFDTADIRNQMRSLDACVTASYQGSLFKDRLERPFAPEESLQDPKFEEAEEKPTPGYFKGVTEYWSMYERKGFRQMVEELGICYKTSSDFTNSGGTFIRTVCHNNIL